MPLPPSVVWVVPTVRGRPAQCHPLPVTYLVAGKPAARMRAAPLLLAGRRSRRTSRRPAAWAPVNRPFGIRPSPVPPIWMRLQHAAPGSASPRRGSGRPCPPSRRRRACGRPQPVLAKTFLPAALPALAPAAAARPACSPPPPTAQPPRRRRTSTAADDHEARAPLAGALAAPPSAQRLDDVDREEQLAAGARSLIPTAMRVASS